MSTTPVTDAAPESPPESGTSHARRECTVRDSCLTLTQQLVLLAVLPALLATLVAAIILSQHHLDSVRNLTRSNAQSMAQQLATTADAALVQADRQALQRVVQTGMQHPHVHKVQIRSTGGELAAQSTSDDTSTRPGLQVIVPVSDAAGIEHGELMIEMSLDSLATAQHTMWVVLPAILAAIGLSVVLFGLWAAQRINAPVRDLALAMDRLGAGEEVQMPLSGSAEMRHLQAGLNNAASALGESQRELKSRVEAATAELARKNRQLEIASQSKTRLLAAASHDLRQPLHALTLFSDSLEEGETDPVRITRIGHIRACVESLDRLFSELLNLSQLDAGVLRPQWSDFPLDQLFDDVSRNFRPVAEKQELRLVVRKTDAWARSDYVMLSRILSNLISNAIRHTKSGGVLVGVRGRGRTLRVEVWDSGEGIAPEHQTRVFEEFYQVDPQRAKAVSGAQGMGLGLSTVRRLADLLNMHLELRSIPGKGTMVRVTVRAVSAREVANRPQLPRNEVRLDGLCVLIIDDERTILEGMQLVLSRWGARVRTASTREEVMELASHWTSPPDVVISDLLLQGPKTVSPCWRSWNSIPTASRRSRPGCS
ncbi:hybrid sensor histidine kinase/response regulator [Diaphorobacter aerolatus]|uniref:hybrid sensor histidine kinase/response regulator n=1 Tax=Diaphorobacter aerolatus TaxID=1288495 RepID=UPI001D0336E7|nr:hybrid sensor histidine kinase/response regulator [Diaphorobacter aerolatus]